MEPPICAICDRDFRDEEDGGDLLHFRRTESDIEWDRRSEEEGFTGHPPYVAWFCVRHLDRASRLRDDGLTLKEALGRLG